MSDKETHNATEPLQPEIENNTEFNIENNVPPPAMRNAIKYPFHLMEVGDSFFVAGNKESKVKNRCANSASRYGKDNNKKFTVRDVTDDNGNITGARCWRLD